jgi:hypothetical protein
MWEPTADDLNDLLAQYREAGDKSALTSAQLAGRDPPADETAKAGRATTRARCSVPKVAGTSVPEGPHRRSFSAWIRNQSDIEDYEVRRSTASIQRSTSIRSSLSLADVRARGSSGSGRDGFRWGPCAAGRDPGSAITGALISRPGSRTPWPDAPGSRANCRAIVFSMEATRMI